jgi:transposase
MALADAHWAVLEPLIETCRAHRKTQHHHLRRKVEAIIWRCQNGAKWRAIPAEYGPWWMAAQTFIR